MLDYIFKRPLLTSPEERGTWFAGVVKGEGLVCIGGESESVLSAAQGGHHRCPSWAAQEDGRGMAEIWFSPFLFRDIPMETMGRIRYFCKKEKS